MDLIYCLLYRMVSWKVHRLNEILPCNVTKWGLFFNTVLFVVHALLSLELQCLNPIGKKIHQQQIWHHYMNFSAHSCTSDNNHIAIYACIYAFVSWRQIPKCIQIWHWLCLCQIVCTMTHAQEFYEPFSFHMNYDNRQKEFQCCHAWWWEVCLVLNVNQILVGLCYELSIKSKSSQCPLPFPEGQCHLSLFNTSKKTKQ